MNEGKNLEAEKKERIPIREGYFYEAAPNGESYLIGSECKLCGYVSFPKREVCPSCIKENSQKEIKLSREGKLHSYSVIHVPLPGYPAPYVIGEIKLPEGPIVTSLITGIEPVEEALGIGDEMELVVGKITEDKKGNQIIGYMFRPKR